MRALSHRMRLLSFDLDGTLADTGTEIAAAANAALADLSLDTRSVADIVLHVGHGGRELMRRLLVDSGAATAPADIDAAHARFDKRHSEVAGTLATLYPRVAGALERLDAAGIALACVTNKSERFAHRVLAACGIEARFGLVVGGDTLAARKPDAAVIGHVLAHFGIDAELVAHVGDSRTDVETARNGGVAAWVVPYGFNGGEPIERASPDRVFADFGEVADFVLAAP